MDAINNEVRGVAVVTAFCLIVFGVFFTIVVTNLA